MNDSWQQLLRGQHAFNFEGECPIPFGIKQETIENMTTGKLDTHQYPHFIIVGAPKAGTTSLFKYLNQHPQVYFPKRKEPMFFCDYDANFAGPSADWYNANMINEPESYLSMFADADEHKVTGEASTDYLSCPNAAVRIKNWNPDIKIIIILRNPIDRAYSEHMNLVSRMREEVDFLESINLEEQRIKNGYPPYFWHVRRGLYYEAVRNYLSIFDQKKVQVLFYDDLTQSPEQVIESILSFLDLETIPVDTSERFNISGRPKSRFLQHLLLSGKKRFINGSLGALMRKNELIGKTYRSLMVSNMEKPKLKKHEFRYVRDIFYEDIIKLQDFLNLDLSHWLELEDQRFG